MEIKLKLIGTLFSAQFRKTTPCLRKKGQSALRFFYFFSTPSDVDIVFFRRLVLKCVHGWFRDLCLRFN